MKRGVLFSLITAVLFVTIEPVSKLIATEVNPYAITFWRFITAAVVILPLSLLKIKKEKVHISLKDFGIMTALGVLFICICMVVLQIGVEKADSPSLIAIIFSSNSIFTILFAVLILKEKLNRNKLIALAFGVLGVLACTDMSAGTNLESVLYAVFAAISFSLYTVLSQKYTKQFGGIIQTGITFFTGSIILFVFLLVLGVDITPSFTPENVLILCFLGFFVTGVGYACYFLAIERGGAIMGSLAFFIKPILTPFVTLVINGIAPDRKVFFAVLCIVIASYFAAYKKEKIHS